MAVVDVVVAQTEGADSRLVAMSFRAIFAGWLIATGIAVLLYVGGLAMGFSAFNAWNGPASAHGIGIGTAIWMVLTWIVSLWLGGMFASWYAAHDDRTIGSLHGVTVWGLSVSVVFLVAIGLGAMHRSDGGMRAGPPPSPGMGMQQGPGAHAADPSVWLGDGSLVVLRAEVQARLSSPDPRTSDQIVAALLGGRESVAVNLFAVSNHLSRAEGASIVASLAADTQAAQIDARQQADRVAHGVAMMLWIVFSSVLLGLIAATLGGWLGAHHIGRIYHLRTFGTLSDIGVRR